MSQIINNPVIPFLSSIDEGLFPGKMIRIQGSVPSTGQRFNINLQCGPNVSPRDDIALHFSVRVAECYIARNTLDKQNWGEEQGVGFNPIGAGQQFEILILCDQPQYKIAVNGKHFCEFPHRIPYHRVSHLTIDGDVSIKLISFETGAPPRAQGYGDVPQQVPSGPPPYGGPPAYGAPPAYGPPGPGQGYGPPGQGPPGAYGPPMGPAPYGAPMGPYGPPPPPGYNPEGEKSGSGLEGFLGQAGAAIAGAFGTSVLQGVLSGSNKNQPQAPPQPPPAQQYGPQPFAGGYGGQSVGGLGSIGSFLSSTLANTLNKPPKKKKHKKMKKALKYGVPAAGLGFGAYAIQKGMKHHHHHHGFHRSSSSSSSSSDSD